MMSSREIAALRPGRARTRALEIWLLTVTDWPMLGRTGRIAGAINIQVYRHLYSHSYNGRITNTGNSLPLMSTAATMSPMGRLYELLHCAGSLRLLGGETQSAWSWARSLARVVERRVEALDAVTLVLKPNRHFRGFRPGQHVNVSAEVNGSRITRSYSLTDVPRKNRLHRAHRQARRGRQTQRAPVPACCRRRRA